jgi:hypothetical protein
MVLLDWTRMGKSYCLAGAVAEGNSYRIVRPLLARNRDHPDRALGWSAYLLDGHCRWEVFQLVAPAAGPPQPPHLEDVWVRSMLPRRRLALPDQRRAILASTAHPRGESLFGQPLQSTASAAYLRPGDGRRSLATFIVPCAAIRFSTFCRPGSPEPDVRVQLSVEGVTDRLLPVKDHHLLRRVEALAADLKSRLQLLHQAVAQMGDQVAVRLGLSRPFSPRPDAAGFCWLMADGFFSLTDPQP